jgi:hypothetical protein
MAQSSSIQHGNKIESRLLREAGRHPRIADSYPIHHYRLRNGHWSRDARFEELGLHPNRGIFLCYVYYFLLEGEIIDKDVASVQLLALSWSFIIKYVQPSITSNLDTSDTASILAYIRNIALPSLIRNNSALMVDYDSFPSDVQAFELAFGKVGREIDDVLDTNYELNPLLEALRPRISPSMQWADRPQG